MSETVLKAEGVNAELQPTVKHSFNSIVCSIVTVSDRNESKHDVLISGLNEYMWKIIKKVSEKKES